jgi:hypothetical protein
MMDITDKDNLWRITYHSITNLITNEVRLVKNIPKGSTISYMNYNLFIRSCEIAFNTGEWPNI